MSEEISKLEQEKQKAEEKEEEKGTRKREIIKNIAIIFLSIMLVLTFFSNTIMNFSLPQVSTELVSSGTIKTQVRGQGVVETVDPYNLTVKETRTIKAVHVKEGDEVKAGDVIYELEGEESSELESAREAVTTAETTYKKAIVTNGLSAEQVLQVESGNTDVNLIEIQNNIAAYDRQIEQFQAEIDLRDSNIQVLTLEKNRLDNSKSADLAAWTTQSAIDSNTYDKESPALTAKVNELANLEKEIETLKELEDPTPEQKAKLAEDEKRLPSVREEATKAQSRLNQLNEAKSNSSLQVTILTNKDADTTKKINELQAQINAETAAKTLTTQAKTEAEDRKKKYVDSMANKIDAIDNYQKLQQAKEKVAKLEQEALGKEITSPVDGKIVTLNKKSGEKTDPDGPVAVIQVDGKGYRISFSVDNKQARTVKVGDVVNIDDYGYSDDTKINLVAINPDKSDPQNKKLLVFDLSGSDIEVGRTINVSVGDASASYDNTVPNSALNKDNKGDYMLVLQEKQVPFGKRYIAKKVEVTKIYAKDDTRSAIEADIDPYGVYVITNSTKPLKGGQQVRLATDSGDN